MVEVCPKRLKGRIAFGQVQLRIYTYLQRFLFNVTGKKYLNKVIEMEWFSFSNIWSWNECSGDFEKYI